MIRHFSLCILLAVSIAACANFAPPISTDHKANPQPQIIGAKGPLSQRQIKAVLAQAGVLSKGQDPVQRYQLIDEMVTGSPMIAGNGTRILLNGRQTFQTMFKVIAEAKDHINLEYFIFEDVDVDGRTLGDLLVEKQAEGVAVNVIYDSFGSDTTPPEFFARLKAAGIALTQFNPTNPLEGNADYALNHRDHRKILVVDGKIGIVGGINLSATYQSAPFGKSGQSAAEPSLFWRDTDLQITGPAVQDLQKAFLEHWAEQKGPPINPANFYPLVAASGAEIVRVVRSAPDHEKPDYYITLLSVLEVAQSRIWLDAAYFVPTHQQKQRLLDAGRRGVDVRLLLPAKSDSARSLAVQHSHYADLLESHVRLYESQDIVLHAKTVVVDSVWSAIGSSNFDYRSVVYNDEVDVIVIGANMGGRLEGMFLDDTKNAREITLKEWNERPLAERLDEYFSRLVEVFL